MAKSVSFIVAAIAGLAMTALAATPAAANPHPLLQLYGESGATGATYDLADETWILDVTPSETAHVWTVGNLAGPGGFSPIKDVHLIAFVDAVPAAGTFTVGRMGGVGSFTVVDPIDGETYFFEDRSTSIGALGLGDVIPFVAHEIAVDGLPTLADGSSLPPHGVHMSGFTHWLDLSLGTFDSPDSEILDFIIGPDLDPTSYFGCSNPEDAATCLAQIAVVDVNPGAGGFTRMHFDLIGWKDFKNVGVVNGGESKFAPFSHDLTDTPGKVPEPGTLALFGFGLAGLGFLRRRPKKQ